MDRALLAQSQMFKDLTDDEAESVGEICEIIELRAGDFVFREGGSGVSVTASEASGSVAEASAASADVALASVGSAKGSWAISFDIHPTASAATMLAAQVAGTLRARVRARSGAPGPWARRTTSS